MMQVRHGGASWRELSWKVVDGVEAARASWQSLAARASDQPFQHPAWIAAWLKTRGRALSVRPRIAVGSHGGQCEMVVPLGVSGRGPCSALRWLGGDASDYNAPLASPELRSRFTAEEAPAFWRFIVGLIGPAAVLDLSNQPERIGGSANPFIAGALGEEACRAHSLRLGAATAQTGLSKRHRKRLRAFERDHGSLAYISIPAGPACGLAVAQIIDWKAQQLARSGGFSPFEGEGVRAFLAAVAGDPSMPLRVAMLRTASLVLAGFILIDGGEAELIYQCAYDPAFAFCSPGTLLRQLVENEAARRGKTVLDFGPGDEPYKEEICDTATRLIRTIRPLQPSGVPLAAVLRARLAVKRRIKSTPSLYQAICRANRAGLVVRRRLPSMSAFRRDPETLETA
jgi:CelD/BcsL family acetyltransferase involved in cellulose biosynthesis